MSLPPSSRHHGKKSTGDDDDRGEADEMAVPIRLVSKSSWSSLLSTRIDLATSLCPVEEEDEGGTRRGGSAATMAAASFSIGQIRFEKPPVSFVGYVRKLIRSPPPPPSDGGKAAGGGGFLVLGTECHHRRRRVGQGGGGAFDVERRLPRPRHTSGTVRIQNWDLISLPLSSNRGEAKDRIVMTSREESVLDLRTRDPASQDNQEEEEGEEEADFERRQRGKKLRVATWSQGTRVVVGQGSRLKVFERSQGQPRTVVELLVDEDLSQQGGGGGIDFDDAKAFFVVDDEPQEEEERSGRGGRHPHQTWIVAVTKRLVDRLQRPDEDQTRQYEYSLGAWVYDERSRRIVPGSPLEHLSPCRPSSSPTINWVSIVPPLSRRWSSSVDSGRIVEVQSVNRSGCVDSWTLELANDDRDRATLREQGQDTNHLASWTRSDTRFETGRTVVRRASSRGNGVIALGKRRSLSLWPPGYENLTNCHCSRIVPVSSDRSRIVDLERTKPKVWQRSGILFQTRVSSLLLTFPPGLHFKTLTRRRKLGRRRSRSSFQPTRTCSRSRVARESTCSCLAGGTKVIQCHHRRRNRFGKRSRRSYPGELSGKNPTGFFFPVRSLMTSLQKDADTNHECSIS